MPPSCQTHVWNNSQKAPKFSRREHHFRVCDVKVTRGCSAPPPPPPPPPCACIWTAAKKAMQRQLRQIGPINNPCNTALGGPWGSDPEMNTKCGFHWRVVDRTKYEYYMEYYAHPFSFLSKSWVCRSRREFHETSLRVNLLIKSAFYLWNQLNFRIMMYIINLHHHHADPIDRSDDNGGWMIDRGEKWDAIEERWKVETEMRRWSWRERGRMMEALTQSVAETHAMQWSG